MHRIRSDDKQVRTGAVSYTHLDGYKRQSQVVERPVLGIRPVEREFVAAVRIVGKIACIHAVRYYEQLHIVEQPMKLSLIHI